MCTTPDVGEMLISFGTPAQYGSHCTGTSITRLRMLPWFACATLIGNVKAYAIRAVTARAAMTTFLSVRASVTVDFNIENGIRRQGI